MRVSCWSTAKAFLPLRCKYFSSNAIHIGRRLLTRSTVSRDSLNCVSTPTPAFARSIPPPQFCSPNLLPLFFALCARTCLGSLAGEPQVFCNGGCRGEPLDSFDCEIPIRMSDQQNGPLSPSLVGAHCAHCQGASLRQCPRHRCPRLIWSAAARLPPWLLRPCPLFTLMGEAPAPDSAGSRPPRLLRELCVLCGTRRLVAMPHLQRETPSSSGASHNQGETP